MAYSLCSLTILPSRLEARYNSAFLFFRVIQLIFIHYFLLPNARTEGIRNADLIVTRLTDTKSFNMRINRVVANVETSDVDRADAFYHGVLGLERIMDHRWIRTYGSNSKMIDELLRFHSVYKELEEIFSAALKQNDGLSS
jgi:hypothetical protein